MSARDANGADRRTTPFIEVPAGAAMGASRLSRWQPSRA
jgi:hypothetical protein